MSIKIESHPSAAGIFTITNPNSPTSRNITLPDASTTLVGTDAIQTLTNKTLILPNNPLVSLVDGQFEYDGVTSYFTAQSRRGIMPAMQFYRLGTPLVGLDATGAQSLFGVGVTLSSNTVYEFYSWFSIFKTAGTTAHVTQLQFGGTAVVNDILASFIGNGNRTGYDSTPVVSTIASTAATAIAGSNTGAAFSRNGILTGTISITTGGTFIPQYSLTAAPGGAYTTAAGSYFAIWPIGTGVSSVSVGSWA